tara:strand:+ start:1720 stop:2199 length:480 start_codon:yes stop_codon:yes gene_type:complete
MEFFTPCWIVLGMMFPSEPSVSYVHKQSKTFAQRLKTCNRVASVAVKNNVDPALAIAVAFSESRFSKPTSDKGAKGPLGVIPRYHCPKSKEKCDYLQAGVVALRKFLDINNMDYCQSLAQYNRGLEGKCKEGRSEYKYAQFILSLYDEICAKTDLCTGC